MAAQPMGLLVVETVRDRSGGGSEGLVDSADLLVLPFHFLFKFFCIVQQDLKNFLILGSTTEMSAVVENVIDDLGQEKCPDYGERGCENTIIVTSLYSHVDQDGRGHDDKHDQQTDHFVQAGYPIQASLQVRVEDQIVEPILGSIFIFVRQPLSQPSVDDVVR